MEPLSPTTSPAPTNAQAAAAARALIAKATKMAEEWALHSGATLIEQAKSRDTALTVVIADALRGQFERPEPPPLLWRVGLAFIAGGLVGAVIVRLLEALP